MNVQEYKQLRAFARFDGLILGLIMCVAFFMSLATFKNPAYELGALTAMLCAPIFVALRLRYYRDVVLRARVSFMRAFGYGMLCAFYGALILAIACYAYFKFFDGGAFYQSMVQYMAKPEMKEALKMYGVDSKLMRESISSIAETRPIEMSIQLIYNVLFIGFFCNLFVALVSKRNPRAVKTDNGKH